MPVAICSTPPAAASRVTISRVGRPPFAAGDLLGGTTEEKARAVEGFVAYAGRYSFHHDRVIHHVELSLFPNWVGSDQERLVELAGDRLTLSASPLLAGKRQVPRLVWERVPRRQLSSDGCMAASARPLWVAHLSATFGHP
jgi:Lipocalin-like domain